jgi:hypothetical protein
VRYEEAPAIVQQKIIEDAKSLPKRNNRANNRGAAAIKAAAYDIYNAGRRLVKQIICIQVLKDYCPVPGYWDKNLK